MPGATPASITDAMSRIPSDEDCVATMWRDELQSGRGLAAGGGLCPTVTSIKPYQVVTRDEPIQIPGELEAKNSRMSSLLFT